jgi:hypothetical protein
VGKLVGCGLLVDGDRNTSRPTHGQTRQEKLVTIGQSNDHSLAGCHHLGQRRTPPRRDAINIAGRPLRRNTLHGQQTVAVSCGQSRRQSTKREVGVLR